MARNQIQNQIPFFLGVIYRKPDYSLSFFDKLETNLDKVFSSTDNVIILGDLNCNMLTKNAMSKKVNELCSTFHLSQLIQEPTRITPNSSTLIDLICVFTSMEAHTIQSGTHPIGISDHSLVYTVLKHDTS